MTGFPPCTPCDKGFYQLNYGAKSCEKCLPNDYLVTSECTQYNLTEQVTSSVLSPTDGVNEGNAAQSVSENILMAVVTVSLIASKFLLREFK